MKKEFPRNSQKFWEKENKPNHPSQKIWEHPKTLPRNSGRTRIR